MTHQCSSAAKRERQIDEQILAFGLTRPVMLFSTLSNALPDYPWHMLFSALGRLSMQRRVELAALQWDYEILFLERTPREPSVSYPPEQCDPREAPPRSMGPHCVRDGELLREE